MLFFHDTNLCRLPPIMEGGLKAHRIDWPDLSNRTGIWLSTDGEWIGRDVRITIKVPSSDRRLHHLPKLLKKLTAKEIANLDAIAVQAGQVNWRTFWIYEGDVAPSRFSEVEIATRAKAA